MNQAAPEPAPATRRPPASKDETSAVTASEGNLSNEEVEVSERSKGSVPEAEENLLKD
jgi:hypothetical protein